MLQLKDYGYDLPEELIAQDPLPERTACRLCVVDRRTRTITHDSFSRIGRYLPEKSILVVNDSKVRKVRLLGRRENTGGQVEVFLLNPLADGYSFTALIRPLGRLKLHERIVFPPSNLSATLEDAAQRIVRFNRKGVLRLLPSIGHIPLPPYIKRPDEEKDEKFYQTVYAKTPGSVAAPTAGLHFSKALLHDLIKGGHQIKRVTLHINIATFKAVQTEDIRRHEMQEEDYLMPRQVLSSLEKAKAQHRKIVAVGTTSCRVLESVAAGGPLKGKTRIFIYPGYEFKATDSLLTNFHLPFSTLLMLVYALGTPELIKKAYAEAIRERYRFFSYGDAMLII